MQTLKLRSLNIWGQELRSGGISVNIEDSTLTTEKGKEFKIVPDYEYTFKINRSSRTINACGGAKGLLEFLQDINTENSPFNPCYTDLFLEL